MSLSHQPPEMFASSDNPVQLRNAVAYSPPSERSRLQSGKTHSFRLLQQLSTNITRMYRDLGRWRPSVASRRVSASILSIQTPTTYWHVSLVFLAHSSGKRGKRSSFPSYSRPGSALPFSSTIELLSYIAKSGTY